MNQDFWKRPRFIASVVALISWLLLPYWRVKMFGVGISATGLDLAKEFSGIDILLWLIPLLNIYLIWAAFNPTHNMAKGANIRIGRIVFLVVAAFFWLRYGFLMEGTKLGFVGLGMWLTLFAAIFIQFEEFITDKISDAKDALDKKDDNPPPPPAGDGGGGQA